MEGREILIFPKNLLKQVLEPLSPFSSGLIGDVIVLNDSANLREEMAKN